MKKGDLFIAYPDVRGGRHLVAVTRVARDGTWADIRVMTYTSVWSKRQPLVDGVFNFPHEPHRPGALSLRAEWESRQSKKHA